MKPNRKVRSGKGVPWWRRPIDEKIEKKLGIFGTRAGVLLVIAIVAGLIANPWLLWFLLISAAVGALVAFFGPFRHRQAANLSITDRNDRDA